MSKYYISNREKIIKIIEDVIIPSLKNKDLNYSKILSYLCLETGTPANTCEEILKTFIESKKINEIRILTISNEQVSDWIKENIQCDKVVRELDGEMKKIEDLVL